MMHGQKNIKLTTLFGHLLVSYITKWNKYTYMYAYVQCHDTLGSQVVVVCVDIMMKLNVFKTCLKFKIPFFF